MTKLSKITTDAPVETSSERIIKKANQVYEIEDENGRVIELKKPGALAQFRLIEMVGSDTAQNQVYMAMVLPLLFVNKIDGVSVFLSTKNELEALIQRLEDEGIEAVVKNVPKYFGKKEDASEGKERIKK